MNRRSLRKRPTSPLASTSFFAPLRTWIENGRNLLKHAKRHQLLSTPGYSYFGLRISFDLRPSASGLASRPLLALFLSCGCLIAPSAFPAPPSLTISNFNLRNFVLPAHPRLLATTNDFARLRSAVANSASPQLKAWQDKLQQEARNLLKAAPSKYEIPDGLRLLATSRRVMHRIYTLALLYQFDGDKRYVERAWQELAAAAAFPDWNPRHFLDTAEMTHAFAIGYDWLYDAWTLDQRETLRRAIINLGLEQSLPIYRGQKGWARAHHNWNQVCNGGMAVGALAIGDLEPDLATEIIRDAVESLPLAMKEFGPDGAWNEGPGYWNYATTYNIVCLAALQSALGTDFGLSDIPGFSLTGLYPLYITGPVDRTFNYADGGDHAVRGAQLFWLANRFNQPILAWYEQQNPSPTALDLLWYPVSAFGLATASSSTLNPPLSTLPLARYFRAAEVVTMRSAWGNKNALFVGFKAGDNKANHSHLDVGSFVFDALGVRWAVDMGADDYNLPGYFGGQRWKYYRLRAEGQNTILVNPGSGPDQDPKAATRITYYQGTPEKMAAIADLTPAYETSAQKLLRGLAMLDRSRVLVQDELKADHPVDVWWFMHTRADIALENGGRIVTLTQDGQKVRAEILSSSPTTFEVMDPVPLPTSPHPPKQADNKGVKKLTVHLKGVTDSRLAILLTPLSGSTNLKPVEVKPLSEW